MNQYAQEMGMSHTKWHNPNGAMISVLQGYYNPQRYDVNANNEITARDMSILAYHIVNDLPEMFGIHQASSYYHHGRYPLRAKL